jgi:hypothetical protein
MIRTNNNPNRALYMMLIFGLSISIILPGCASVPNTPLKTMERGEAMLDSIVVAPVEVRDSPIPIISDNWRQNYPLPELIPTEDDYQRALAEKIKESGLAKQVFTLLEENERFVGQGNLLCDLQIDKSRLKFLGYNWKTGLLVLGIGGTFFLGYPLFATLDNLNYSAELHGSIRLVDAARKLTLFRDDVKVMVTITADDYNIGKVLQKLPNRTLNNFAVIAVERIKKALGEDPKLYARARVLSRETVSTSVVRPSRPEPALPAEPLSGIGERYALVVGISSYADSRIGRLAYADDDARAVREWLIDDGFVDEDHIMTLIDQEADKRSIEAALHGFLGKAGPRDIILVYWSGHGYVDPRDKTKAYFACYDTDVLEPWTGVGMGDVRRVLEGHGARNVVFLADTCHSGGIYASRGYKGIAVTGVGVTDEHVKRLTQAGKGTVFFVAGDTDRKALETKQFKNGLFTYTMLEALSGKADGYHGTGKQDKLITVGEMMEYVEDKLPDISLEALGYVQRPAKYIGSGDETVRNLLLGVVSK